MKFPPAFALPTEMAALLPQIQEPQRNTGRKLQAAEVFKDPSDAPRPNYLRR